ncbi:UNVERIFIED_CONTAM: hypothetical protein ABIC26_000301 [Paenibacillus sp. PvR008]
MVRDMRVTVQTLVYTYALSVLWFTTKTASLVGTQQNGTKTTASGNAFHYLLGIEHVGFNYSKISM